MSLVVAAALGVLGWTFIEYVFHRFLAHTFTFDLRFRREHLMHHRKREYFATPADKARLAATTTALILLVAVPLVGWAHGAVFTVSLVGAYLVYEWIHRDLHVAAPRGAYGRWARRHHLQHHHGDPQRNHGVTSPLWDVVFGTLAPIEVVRIPAGKLPRWLDPEAQAPWRADYEVLRARAPEPALAAD
ncbi:MAG: sterol desaturase family protein [Alphaproteobacteria bacterium]|nr:sterol desaturase family protein [Alphaproteobacteria bacterium]